MRTFLFGAALITLLAGCEAVKPTQPASTNNDLLNGTRADATKPQRPATDEPEDLLAIEVARDTLVRDRVVTLYNLAMERAAKALKEGEFDTAIRSAQDARLLIDTNEQYLTAREVRTLRDAAGTTATKAQNYKDAAAEQKGSLDKAKGPTPDERAAIREAQRQKRIASLLDDARTLADKQRYIEAVDAYRQVLAVDPTNDAARLELRKLEDRTGYRVHEAHTTRAATEIARQQTLSKETQIPYSDTLTYPEDWLEKTRARTK